MAIRKLTISLEDDLWQEVSQRSGNFSGYVAEALRWRLALERQAEAIDRFIEETGIAPDPAEYQRALKALGG